MVTISIESNEDADVVNAEPRRAPSPVHSRAETSGQMGKLKGGVMGGYLARRIKYLRVYRGLTQKDLAKLLGTGQSRIAQSEDPAYDKMSLATLRKLSKALGCRLFVDLVVDIEEGEHGHLHPQSRLHGEVKNE